MTDDKRPKYVQEFISEVNEFLYRTKEKDEYCPLFMFATQYLLKKKMYKGYNFYKDKEFEGKTFRVLAGSADKDKYEYLQIW